MTMTFWEDFDLSLLLGNELPDSQLLDFGGEYEWMVST